MSGIEPEGTYRPQYRARWRGGVAVLNRFPRVKRRLADLVRRVVGSVFEPAMVTTERVVEYPFVFQNLGAAGGRVLDIGCCFSRLPLALAARGFSVVGVDFNPYPFGHPRLAAVRGDVMALPFAPATFDTVIAISVIEHVGLGHYTDPTAEEGDRRSIREMARVARPGGRLLVTVPFGVARTFDWARVYDAPRLRALVKPVGVERVEYARSIDGVWSMATEAEAATVDWAGAHRAVALVVATRTA